MPRFIGRKQFGFVQFKIIVGDFIQKVWDCHYYKSPWGTRFLGKIKAQGLKIAFPAEFFILKRLDFVELLIDDMSWPARRASGLSGFSAAWTVSSKDMEYSAPCEPAGSRSHFRHMARAILSRL